MKKQQGYTLLETLIAMLIVAALGASGLYGWQRWQQQQRLWQTACQVRDYLLREGGTWCLASSATSRASCQPVSPLIFAPLWADVEMADITPSLAFFGLRNTAWAGHIRLKNAAGEWRVVVSGWGRIRLCERDEARLCQ